MLRPRIWRITSAVPASDATPPPPLPPLQGEATVPSLLGDELATNPFLRPGDPAIRAALGVPADAPDEEAFAAIRAAKDSFR